VRLRKPRVLRSACIEGSLDLWKYAGYTFALFCITGGPVCIWRAPVPYLRQSLQLSRDWYPSIVSAFWQFMRELYPCNLSRSTFSTPG